MNEQLRLLVELQKLDTEIIGKSRIIQGAPGKISSFEKKLKAVEAEFEKKRSELGSVKKKLKDRELELESINDKIEKLKTRTADIKTNKEYQAHVKEIEAADAEMHEFENEVLVFMEKLDSVDRTIGAEQHKAEEQKQAVQKEMRDFEEGVRRMEVDISALNDNRSAHKASIDEEIYEQYMEALDFGEGTAVVAAGRETCQGCNMRFPPQQYFEVKKNKEIIHCPQCKRILFYVEEPEG